MFHVSFLISSDVEIQGALDVIAKRRSSGLKVHRISNQAHVLKFTEVRPLRLISTVHQPSYNGRD